MLAKENGAKEARKWNCREWAKRMWVTNSIDGAMVEE